MTFAASVAQRAVHVGARSDQATCRTGLTSQQALPDQSTRTVGTSGSCDPSLDSASDTRHESSQDLGHDPDDNESLRASKQKLKICCRLSTRPKGTCCGVGPSTTGPKEQIGRERGYTRMHLSLPPDQIAGALAARGVLVGHRVRLRGRSAVLIDNLRRRSAQTDEEALGPGAGSWVPLGADRRRGAPPGEPQDSGRCGTADGFDGRPPTVSADRAAGPWATASGRRPVH